MINIFYGSKKIILKGYDCKFGNNLREVKLNLADIKNIDEFLKSESGPDIETESVRTKDGKTLSQIFQMIDAAGGLIKNDEGNYLFIFRRNKWDLPKGKVDKNENFEEAAIREVKEESGLKKVNIEGFIRCTFHIYPLKGKFVLKTTNWFLMSAPGKQKLTPQSEEDITEILWLDSGNIQKVKTNTYPSVLGVLDSCFKD